MKNTLDQTQNTGKICSFVGHRDAPQSLYPHLVTEISHLVEIGVSEFWVGGYGNFDRMAAQAVREVKRSYQYVNLMLIFAYLPADQKPDLQGYDNSIYPEGLESVPKRYAISRRNQWILNHIDILIAYVTRSWGEPL